MKIVSRGFTEGYYYKPRVDYEVLEEYHEGIIALSACLAGEVQKNILRGCMKKERAALRYQDFLEKEIFSWNCRIMEFRNSRSKYQHLMRLCHRRPGLNWLRRMMCIIHYAEDAKAHDILLCIQTGKKLADEDRMRYEGGQYYIKSRRRDAEVFPYALQALENTQKIADRCNVEIEFGVTKLPKYDVPEGYTSWEYLNKLCFDGLKERYPDGDDSVERTSGI